MLVIVWTDIHTLMICLRCVKQDGLGHHFRGKE